MSSASHHAHTQVDARQYPVTVHFSKRTETTHYLNETYKKICQIHRRLPDGGTQAVALYASCYYTLPRNYFNCTVWSNVSFVHCFEGILVFLTGKREISYMCRKVSKALNGKKWSALSLSSGASIEGSECHTDSATVIGVDGLSRKRSREMVGDVSATESSSEHADSSTPSSGYVSSIGALRGLDDDEIDGEDGEGGAVDGQDDDLFFEGADYSDGEDYESEEDGDGYDSLGEEVIFAEEKAKRSVAHASVLLPTLKGQEKAEDGGDKDEDAVRLRNKMLKEVLGLPE